MIKAVCLCFVIFIMCNTLYADKANVPFERMIVQSEYILIGEIVSVDSLTYQYRVSQSIIGEVEGVIR